MDKRLCFERLKELVFRVLALLDMLEEHDISEKTQRTLTVIDPNGERRTYKEY